MDIGKLNKRCRIEKPVITQEDVYGTQETSWTTHAVVWCNVQDVLPSRDESIRGGVTAATSKTRLRMRYRGDIDTSMRVVMFRPLETIYNVIGYPAEIGNRDGIEIMIERT